MNNAPGASPAFLTRNYLSRYAKNASDLIVSSGDTTKHRLYDMDPLSRWQSQGSSDGDTQTIEFGLWRPGSRMSFDVANIFIQNHNIENLTLEHSNTNGAPWTTGYSNTALTKKNLYIPLVSTAMDRIKISMSHTQTPDEEKKVGDIIVCGAAFQPGPFFEFKPEPPKVQLKGAKMADGSLRGSMIGRSDASFHFWAAKCAWILDPADYSTEELFEAALASFKVYGLQGTEFVFYPEPGNRPDDIFLCRVRPGTYNDNWIVPSRGGDMRGIQMVIEEIGGA